VIESGAGIAPGKPRSAGVNGIAQRLALLPPILASFAGIVFALMHYPLNPFLLGAALLAYAAILWRIPESWLFFIPAILPLANFSAWSGWLFFEELDLFVLATVAVGYWRLMPKKPIYGFSPVPAMLLMLLAISYGVSAYIGVMPLQKLDANAFSNYLSHYNSLRILKPFVWALLLLPLLRRTENRFLVPGMLAGLAIVAFSGIWERLAFTGLMNFSSDYRITAPFPEMHTGGAALDAFLALSLPFAVFQLFRSRGWRSGVAILLLAAATYTTFVTFSRGLYLGYGVSVVALAFFTIAGGKNSGSRGVSPGISMPVFALTVVAAILLVKTFDTSGYRGLAAAIGLMAAAFFTGGTRSLSHGKAAAGAATFILGLVCLALIAVFAKGPYLAFGLSAAVFSLGAALHEFRYGNMKNTGMMLAYAGFFAMGPCDLAVNWHWGGGNAAVYGALVWAFSMALALGNRGMKKPLWNWNRQGAMAVALGLMLSGVAIPVLWNPYMNNRVEDAQSDMNVRMTHWRSVIEMTDSGWKARVFGMGLGRFPETYFWQNSKQDFPGMYRIVDGKSGPYLRLEGSKYQQGGGEFLRYGQRIGIEPYQTYTLQFDARTTFANMYLLGELCEKYLLYVKACFEAKPGLNPDGNWHHYKVEMRSGSIGSEPWYERPTVQFSLANEQNGDFLDVKNVRLGDENGRNLIHNGDFLHGTDHWYFSSDHYHLPWHAKNLGLDLFFDQGLFGLISFCLLFLYALARQAKVALSGDRLAATRFASLAGFLMVGLFDSILDFPRLSLLFYLMLFIALSRPANRMKSASGGLVRRKKMA
jgi:hypothetical protein